MNTHVVHGVTEYNSGRPRDGMRFGQTIPIDEIWTFFFFHTILMQPHIFTTSLLIINVFLFVLFDSNVLNIFKR